MEGKSRHPAIVIGRQFGSGGRRIGKMIADKLDIAYYDTELLAKAAGKLGLREEIFKENDEKRPSFLSNFLQGSYGIPEHFQSGGLSRERIYSEQSRVILDVCKEAPCVIVGRTADIILKGNKPVFSVFLHSPIEIRAAKIVERREAKTIEKAIELARSRDKARESFYNYYAGEKNWGVASNYDLCIDTSGLDDEEIASLIIRLAQIKDKQK